MNNTTVLLDESLLDKKLLDQEVLESIPLTSEPLSEPLLRQALGATLREFRSREGMTLRELAAKALVSPGYLSEIERGRKEVSSELLASICHALHSSVASVIVETASMMMLDAAAAELHASWS